MSKLAASSNAAFIISIVSLAGEGAEPTVASLLTGSGTNRRGAEILPRPGPTGDLNRATRVARRPRPRRRPRRRRRPPRQPRSLLLRRPPPPRRPQPRRPPPRSNSFRRIKPVSRDTTSERSATGCKKVTPACTDCARSPSHSVVQDRGEGQMMPSARMQTATPYASAAGSAQLAVAAHAAGLA